MISKHQPTLFHGAITACVSSLQDGDMKFGIIPDNEVVQNRENFLRECGITLDHAVLVNITYDKSDFTVYSEVTTVDAGQGMRAKEAKVADGLVTRQPGVALFLPVADCVGTILYDPTQRVLMVSHLGRQSIEQRGGKKSVEYLQKVFGCNPAELVVWLSPAPGQLNYPLYAFDNRGMHDVVVEQVMATGVDVANIEVSAVDTTQSGEYFSHSAFLKGERAEDGRFAVVAMMPVMGGQGEPAV